ncbi:MAG: DUF885 domain-containing protein, partial [Acidobacteriota bacterium]|nr:DUF885 domain-containing protein [Acidobacteriota bacterium]
MPFRSILLLCFLLNGAQAESFSQLADRYFDEVYFRFNPTAGTSAGFHQYDAKLEDYSKSAVDAEIAALHRFEKLFIDFDARQLSQELRADRELVLANIRASLLNQENIRFWGKNPDRYSSGISSSVFTLISRSFAPPAERLQSVVAREKQMPQVFAAARANLKNPPRIYTAVAIEQLPGIVSFFEKDVPLAFNNVHDARLIAEFNRTNHAVIDSLNQYALFLKNDLLPRSHGDFRLGAENFRRKLSYEEMVDTPLDQLLRIGYR